MLGQTFVVVIPMILSSRLFKSLLVLTLSLLLFACGNSISRLSDAELRSKVQGCDYAVNLNTADYQVCENYRRECKRRLKSEGRFVCN